MTALKQGAKGQRGEAAPGAALAVLVKLVQPLVQLLLSGLQQLALGQLK